MLNDLQVKVSYLLYMDYLKIDASSHRELKNLLSVTEAFIDDISVEFGYEKSLLLKSDIQNTVGFELQDGATTDPLNEEPTYKY